MASINIKESQLYELCCNCLKALVFLGIKEKSSGEFEANDLLKKLTNILHLSFPNQTTVVGAHQNNDAIAFSLFSAWFAFKLTGQLGTGLKMWTEYKKASPLSSNYATQIESYVINANIILENKEFLVDYYIHPQEHFHCPILTMESESQEDANFFDLSKLLLVNSPRRVYIGNVKKGKLDDAVSKIKVILDQALASGAIHYSDQIVLVLYKNEAQTIKLRIYDYDQYRHL